ncbi:hypothetical protein [Streptomyces anthocyanicus]|uniref:hypothetical protein n=1 Tax=Streptomyces anthocyanicus TaxID=68174 RepID=UPI002F91B571|nr:hypothetical protein OH747_39705 [Streptomyces anthocyanicus]
MSNALPPAPAVIEGRVSIVRLHGEACFDCGAVNRTLRAAGHVVVNGSNCVWEISTCGCRRIGVAA